MTQGAATHANGLAAVGEDFAACLDLLARIHDREADAGFLFHAPDNVIAEFPQFPAVDEYDDLLELITAELA